jgi:protein SCO1
MSRLDEQGGRSFSGVGAAARARRSAAVAACALLLACAQARDARGQTGAQQARPQPQTPPQADARGGRGQARINVPDVEVRTHEGKRVRFYSDLVRGKIVVITFVYTSCPTFCSMQGDILSKLQDVLGERLGRDVFIVSVSRDPETDTPARLKSWGRSFKSRAGWTLVTGERGDIDRVMQAFTGTGAGPGTHQIVAYVGNDAEGLWSSALMTAEPAMWLKLLEEVGGSGN